MMLEPHGKNQNKTLCPTYKVLPDDFSEEMEPEVSMPQIPLQ